MSERKSIRNFRIVMFRVGIEFFALDISCVNEIVKMQEITEIPDTKEYIKGVINLRGKIIPVLSPERRLGFNEAEYDKKSRIIITSFDDYEVGLIVNEVFKVLAVAPESLEAATEEIRGEGECSFENIYKFDGKVIGIINLGMLLERTETS